MNLSEYLNILYPVIGGTQTKAFFIKSLIINSTKRTKKDQIQQLEEKLENFTDNWYDKIYNGHSILGKKLTREIINIFDSEELEDYLNTEYSKEAIECIGDRFIEKGIPIKDGNIIGLCALTFKEILFSIVYKPRKKTQKEDPNIMDLDPFIVPKESKMPADFIAQLHRNRLVMNFTRKRYTIEEIKNLHGA